MGYRGVPEASGPIGVTRPRKADSLDVEVDDGWISDTKSNRSDIELVNIDARPPLQEGAMHDWGQGPQ